MSYFALCIVVMSFVGLYAVTELFTTEWLILIRDVGILSVLVFFFTWTAWKREERISHRVKELEQFVQERLMQVANISTEALKDNTNALRELIGTLKTRPCLFEGDTVINRLESIALSLKSKDTSD